MRLARILANTASAGGMEGGMKDAFVPVQSQMAASLVERQYSPARLRAFDGMPGSLTVDRQGLARQSLARRALSRSQTSCAGLMGKVNQGAGIESALQAVRARER